MNAQKLGTKIHTATDFEVTALVMSMDGDARLLVACRLLNKTPANYAHLDKGRRAMTGANLLRGAARRDPSFVAKLRAEMDDGIVATIAKDFKQDVKHVEEVLKEEDEVAAFTVKGEGSIDIAWPKSARFKFAQRQDNGEWKFFYNAPKAGSYFTR